MILLNAGVGRLYNFKPIYLCFPQLFLKYSFLKFLLIGVTTLCTFDIILRDLFFVIIKIQILFFLKQVLTYDLLKIAEIIKKLALEIITDGPAGSANV